MADKIGYESFFISKDMEGHTHLLLNMNPGELTPEQNKQMTKDLLVKLEKAGLHVESEYLEAEGFNKNKANGKNPLAIYGALFKGDNASDERYQAHLVLIDRCDPAVLAKLSQTLEAPGLIANPPHVSATINPQEYASAKGDLAQLQAAANNPVDSRELAENWYPNTYGKTGTNADKSRPGSSKERYVDKSAGPSPQMPSATDYIEFAHQKPASTPQTPVDSVAEKRALELLNRTGLDPIPWKEILRQKEPMQFNELVDKKQFKSLPVTNVDASNDAPRASSLQQPPRFNAGVDELKQNIRTCLGSTAVQALDDEVAKNLLVDIAVAPNAAMFNRAVSRIDVNSKDMKKLVSEIDHGSSPEAKEKLHAVLTEISYYKAHPMPAPDKTQGAGRQ